jgi:tetratricopeptide (TPR) repeat protein
MMALFFITRGLTKSALLFSVFLFTGCAPNLPPLKIPFIGIEKKIARAPSAEQDDGATPQSDKEWETRLFKKKVEGTDTTPILENKSVTSEQFGRRRVNPATQSLSSIASEAFNQGDWDRDKSALERAIKIEPDNGSLWRQLSYTHFRSGNNKQALVYAQRSLLLSNYSDNGRKLSSDLLVLITKKIEN